MFANTYERVVRRRGVLVAAAAALAAIACGQGVAEAVAPVPCSPRGSDRHNCTFYIPGNGKSGGAPVQAASRTVGYLHEGTKRNGVSASLSVWEPPPPRERGIAGVPDHLCAGNE